MANAPEARLQSVAGSGTYNQVYDPNPSNDNVKINLTNTKQFTSSATEIQKLLNNMWAAVHAGSVSGYHAALQQVDSWYGSNGQQNYYTGLTDGQVAAFNPANNPGMTEMPNANPTVATAELAAITGQSAAMSNLASAAQSASTSRCFHVKRKRLLILQRPHGIDARGAPSRHERRQEGYERKDSRRCGQHHRVGGFDAE